MDEGAERQRHGVVSQCSPGAAQMPQLGLQHI
jgi:hypothetical protein